MTRRILMANKQFCHTPYISSINQCLGCIRIASLPKDAIARCKRSHLSPQERPLHRETWFDGWGHTPDRHKPGRLIGSAVVLVSLTEILFGLHQARSCRFHGTTCPFRAVIGRAGARPYTGEVSQRQHWLAHAETDCPHLAFAWSKLMRLMAKLQSVVKIRGDWYDRIWAPVHQCNRLR